MDRLTPGFADDALPHLVRDVDHPCGGWAVELLSWIGGLREISRPAVLSWEGATQAVGPDGDVEFIAGDRFE